MQVRARGTPCVPASSNALTLSDGGADGDQGSVLGKVDIARDRVIRVPDFHHVRRARASVSIDPVLNDLNDGSCPRRNDRRSDIHTEIVGVAAFTKMGKTRAIPLTQFVSRSHCKGQSVT